MCSHEIEGRNGEPHYNQHIIISDTNASTRDNFGDFQEAVGTTGLYNIKNINHKENITRKEEKGR